MRFRGVKVIVRDGLEVDDRLRKDMFLAWQDLQLLHAIQPGLQYKHKFGGNKSWKVSSLNGVDRIELLGYPPEKKIKVGRPKIRTRKRVFLWPAFEVYSEPDGDGEYLGIVICRGGGFEPPYEFITKEFFPEKKLPEDKNFRSAGPLPEERNWIGIPKSQNIINLRYEDLEPIGRAYLLTTYANGLPHNSFTQYSFDDYDVDSCIHDTVVRNNIPMCIDHGYIESYIENRMVGHAIAHDTWSSGVSMNDDIVLTYRFEDDPEFGDWDSFIWYDFNGAEIVQNLGKIPARIINSSLDLHYSQNGSGSGRTLRYDHGGYGDNTAIDSPFSGFYWFVNCFRDTNYQLSDLENRLMLEIIAMYNPIPLQERPVKNGGVSFTYTESTQRKTLSGSFAYGSAVYDDDIYTFVAQDYLTTESVNNSESSWTANPIDFLPGCGGSHPEPNLIKNHDTDSTFGDIFVSLNDEIFVLDIGFSGWSVSQRPVKLFKTGDRYDSLSNLWVYDPGEAVCWNQIIKYEDEPGKIFTTILGDEEPLEGILDPDGRLLYPFGYRLIQEITTILEEYI